MAQHDAAMTEAELRSISQKWPAFLCCYRKHFDERHPAISQITRYDTNITGLAAHVGRKINGERPSSGNRERSEREARSRNWGRRRRPAPWGSSPPTIRT